MKALFSITAAFLLCSSIATASTVTSPAVDTKVSPAVSVPLQAEKPAATPAKLCPNGTLDVAGKCHERAEPCVSNSECCSKKCRGGSCD